MTIWRAKSFTRILLTLVSFEVVHNCFTSRDLAEPGRSLCSFLAAVESAFQPGLTSNH
jgi:hypothetical protein